MTRDERIATSVDKETKQKFRVEAAKQDMDMSQLMRQLIEDYLEAEEGNPKPTPTAMTA